MATSPETVTTCERSAGVPKLLWKHSRLVPESHDDVSHAPSAICVVGVVSASNTSVQSKLSPETVTLSAVVNGRLGLSESLRIGAVHHPI